MSLARAVARKTLRTVAGEAVEGRAHAAYHAMLRATRRFRPPETGETLALLGTIVGGSRTVLDVGANVRRYSHFFRSRSPAARIYAFEPNPGAAALLRKTLAGDPGAVVFTFALGETAGEALLRVPRDRLGLEQSALSHVVGAAACGRDDCLPVAVRRLDDLAASGAIRLEAPVFMKIDVEGSECGVLCGARRVLEQHRPAIYFESQGDDDCRRRLYRTLAATGYRVYCLERGRLHVLTELPPGTTNCITFPAETALPWPLSEAAS